MKHCFPEEPKSCLTLLEMFFTLCEAAFELPVDQQQPVNVPFEYENFHRTQAYNVYPLAAC